MSAPTHERLSVAVTGMNATDNPAPGVAVIRAIRAACPECRAIGLAYGALDPGDYMDGIADHVYLIPYPSQGAEVFLERLEAIHARTPIDVFVPTLDAELATILKIRARLGELGIKTFLPDESALERRGKERLHELNLHGIPVPAAAVLTDPAHIPELADEVRFPLLVKGRFYDAYVAHNPAEVAHWYDVIASKWGLPVILQAFVSGQEFDVVGVGDGEGGLIGAVPMRKMQLTDKGKAWGGVTVHAPDLERLTAELVRVLRWRGPFEAEYIRAAGDGRPWLIEVNPRFPAWVYLSVGAGRNLPWAVVRLALGEAVAPMPPAEPGIMFLRHSLDQITTLADYEALSVYGELHREEIGP